MDDPPPCSAAERLAHYAELKQKIRDLQAYIVRNGLTIDSLRVADLPPAYITLKIDKVTLDSSTNATKSASTSAR
jgi:hypothetical protein